MKQLWSTLTVLVFLLGCNGAGKDSEPVAEEKGTKTETKTAATLSEGWLKGYVAAQEALAADDYEAAKTALDGLHTQSEGDMKTMVATAAGASDIEHMRAGFKPFSEQIKEASLPAEHIVVFCPMAFNNTGAHWVQKDGEVMNPYFGASMLHCGAVVKRGGGEGEQ